MFHFPPEAREKIREICKQINEHKGAEWWQPFFEKQIGDMCTDYGFNKQVRASEHDLGVIGVDFKGKKVLDAGCGSGLFSVMIATLGAADVQGIDIWDAALKLSNGYLKDVIKGELPVRITSQDSAKLDFPDSYFDVIVCREAISHFHKPYGFLDESVRMLKKGGRILVSDANNGANPWVRYKTCGIWRRYENGPLGQWHCMNLTQTIADRRRDILRESFPDMSTADVDDLGDRTFGMSAEEIVEAGNHYKATGNKPDSRYAWGKCAVDPDTGMYQEQLFSPHEVADYLKQRGIKTSIHAYFSHGRHPVLAAISRGLETVSFATVYCAPVFQIAGTKL